MGHKTCTCTPLLVPAALADVQLGSSASREAQPLAFPSSALSLWPECRAKLQQHNHPSRHHLSDRAPATATWPRSPRL